MAIEREFGKSYPAVTSESRNSESEKSIIAQALQYETSPKEFNLNINSTNPLFAEVVRTVNTHFKEVLLPQMSERGEHFVESFIGTFTWGRVEDTVFWDGFSKRNIFGTKAFGYLVLSDKNIYIRTFGQLSKKFIPKRGFFDYLLLNLAGTIDNTRTETKDTNRRISYKSLKAIQLYPDERIGKIDIDSSEFQFSFSTPGQDQEIIYTAIDMGAKGELTKIWNPETGSAEIQKTGEDIFIMIANLKILKDSDAISEQDFEDKKKQLLERL